MSLHKSTWCCSIHFVLLLSSRVMFAKRIRKNPKTKMRLGIIPIISGVIHIYYYWHYASTAVSYHTIASSNEHQQHPSHNKKYVWTEEKKSIQRCYNSELNWEGERNSIAMKLNRGHCIPRSTYSIRSMVLYCIWHRTSNYAIKSKSTGKICLEYTKRTFDRTQLQHCKHWTNL